MKINFNKTIYDLTIIFTLLLIIVIYHFREIIYCNLKRKEGFVSDIDNNDNDDSEIDLMDLYEDGVFKQIPLGKNSLQVVDNDFSGVFRSVRKDEYTDNYHLEIPYYVMNKLIKLERTHFLGIINDEIKKKNKIYNILLKEINVNLIKSEDVKLYDKKRKFKIGNIKVIHHEIDEYNIIDTNFIFVINIYREKKDINYVLQVFTKYTNDKVFFENIQIIGSNMEETIEFDNLYNKFSKDKFCFINKNTKGFENIMSCHTDIKTKNLDKYNKEVNRRENKFIEDKDKEVEQAEIDKHYGCFSRNNDRLDANESYCKSQKIFLDKDGNQIEQTYGIWDKPCIEDKDCPFYKKNKNYINNRGGCIKPKLHGYSGKYGHCEMPINAKRVGYKKYINPPFCHGCKGIRDEECCERQKDRKLFPELKSPHYIFHNDNINIEE